MTPERQTTTSTAQAELGDTLEASWRESATRTQLTEEAGFLRTRARLISDDTQGLHHRSRLQEWHARSSERGKQPPLELLSHLSELGFSWRDIARMLRVSVPAVQKWRQGQAPTGEKRRLLSSLVAACDLISQQGVSETASWFEMPLVVGVPITPIHLYASERFQLLFDYASSHSDPVTVLDQLDPDWRVRYSSDFEVFTAGDGELSIRSRA